MLENRRQNFVNWKKNLGNADSEGVMLRLLTVFCLPIFNSSIKWQKKSEGELFGASLNGVKKVMGLIEITDLIAIAA